MGLNSLKIGDLGLAKLIEEQDPNDARRLQHTHGVGTAGYMSPEQVIVSSVLVTEQIHKE